MDGVLTTYIILNLMMTDASGSECTRDTLHKCSSAEIAELQREDAEADPEFAQPKAPKVAGLPQGCKATGEVRHTGSVKFKCNGYYVWLPPTASQPTE